MDEKPKNDWREVCRALAVCAAYLLFTTFAFSCLYADGSIVANGGVSSTTIGERLAQDAVIRVGFPLVLIGVVLIRKRSVASLGFTKQSPKTALVLAGVYLALFALFGEKTVTGVYLWAYYLIGVALPEELVFRGYLFNRLYAALNGSKRAAIIAGVVSGALWGAMHAIVPAIVGDANIVAGVLSNLGGGIVAGAVFAFALYKSKSLFVPMFIHAIMDYLGVIA